jgi:hypothetical protein
MLLIKAQGEEPEMQMRQGIRWKRLWRMLVKTFRYTESERGKIRKWSSSEYRNVEE